MTNTKQYLQSIQKSNSIIEQKKNFLYGLHSTVSDLNTAGTDKKNSALMKRIIELEHEIDNGIQQIANVQNRIINEIQRLDNTLYSTLLYKRYVQCKSLRKIAKELKYSYGYIRNMHTNALKEFDEVITKS